MTVESNPSPDPLRSRAAAATMLAAVSTETANPAVIEAAAADHRSLPGSDARGDVVWAYIELVDALALASRWEPAIRQAEPDADRFARAARLRAQAVLDAERRTNWPAPLEGAAALLAELTLPQQALQAAALLARVALPVRHTDLFVPSSQEAVRHDREEGDDRPPQVALLIEHRGEPIMRPTPLVPGAMHQLEVEGRLAGWPEGVDALLVDFLTVHPPEYLYLSAVTFRPDQLNLRFNVPSAAS